MGGVLVGVLVIWLDMYVNLCKLVPVALFLFPRPDGHYELQHLYTGNEQPVHCARSYAQIFTLERVQI